MVEGFYCIAESISFLFHIPMSIAYLLWLISFYHSSFYVNKDFLLSVIWFNAYLVPPTWVKKYYKWGWGSGVGGGGERERGERFYCNIPCGKNLKSQRRSQPQKKSFRNFITRGLFYFNFSCCCCFRLDLYLIS